MSEYDAYCEEHELKLNPDGSCPKCRDSQGNPFPLDMQSTYLQRKDYTPPVKS